MVCYDPLINATAGEEYIMDEPEGAAEFFEGYKVYGCTMSSSEAPLQRKQSITYDDLN